MSPGSYKISDTGLAWSALCAIGNTTCRTTSDTHNLREQSTTARKGNYKHEDRML